MTQNLSTMILGQNCQPRYINVLQTVIIQKKKSKHAAEIVEIHQDKNVNICMAAYISNSCCINLLLGVTTLETTMFLSNVSSLGFIHSKVLLL